MTEKKGRTVSRRGLLGIFGAEPCGFSDALQKESQSLAPGAPRPAAPAPSYQRRLRPPERNTVPALLEESGVWGVDLRRFPLSVGLSWRIVGEGLAEPLLVVRVSETHYAVVGGECPVDGSDLIWLAYEDRVACPSCGSRWRLDGAVTRGPADSSSASFVAEDVGGSSTSARAEPAVGKFEASRSASGLSGLVPRRRVATALLALTVATSLAACGVSTARGLSTRYYVVRHGEKSDDADDSGLKRPEGFDRARALADALAGQGIDRIFVSDRRRMQETAEPIERALHLQHEVFRKADTAGLIAKLKSIDGGNVLVVWRHSEIAEVVDALLGAATDEPAEKIDPLAEWEYDKMFVVTKSVEQGKTSTRLERRRFGAESRPR